jgi:predicted flap endonuclease-1-like 5' DNA nuclease
LGYILWSKWQKLHNELQAEHERLKALHLQLEKDHASLRYRCEELEKDNDKLHRKVMGLEGDVTALKFKLEKCEENNLAAMGTGGIATAAAMVISKGVVAPPPPVPDDLKIVEGIGPKIEKLCNDNGIWTWRQLADTSVEFLRKMLDDAGPNYRISKPETWPKQAELAAEGKMDELKEYQDFLLGGRNPDEV